MILPQPDQFIDIHTHGAKPVDEVYAVENIMAHEGLASEDIKGVVFTAGIHPWYLNESNYLRQVEYIKTVLDDSRLIAVGEAGFDKLRGPGLDLQKLVFTEQVKIASAAKKPVIIHCVRSWDTLLEMHRILKPSTPWMIHGFRGKKELASQLLSRGMFISFWFNTVIRSESSDLVRHVPPNRIFLETDGADIDIRDIYVKVANDLAIRVDELKGVIFRNFNEFFGR